MRTYLFGGCMLACIIGLTGCDDSGSYADAPLPGTVTSQTLVGTATITGTVLGVEPIARRVTIACDDGVTRTVLVGKDVGNLEQVKVGDRVSGNITVKLATFLSKADTGPGLAAGDSIAKVTDGSQGTVDTSQMRQVTSRVVAIDVKNRTIRLEDPSGEVHDWDVPADVDLAAVNVGDDIVARFTETVNVLVRGTNQDADE